MAKRITTEDRHAHAICKMGYNQDTWYTKRGRKTLFRKSMIEEVKKLAGLGLTMEEIATFWRLGLRTIKRYAQKRADFRHALKAGRLIADKKVDEALYKRAVGFESTERHYEIEYDEAEDGKVNAVRKLKKEIVKHVAGDVTAQIYWSKNRRPDKWRDDKGLSLFGPEGEPVTVNYIPAKLFLKNQKGKIKELSKETH